MRHEMSVVCAIFLATAGAAQAADPTGDWRIEDGRAIIRIDNCSGALWGIVAWEKERGGRDLKNPNPALRERPTLGLPIIRNMRPTAQGRWQGQAYNAENGQTYNTSIRMVGENVLRIEGCVLGGLFCGGQQWTRVGATEQGKSATTGRGGRSDVCSRISNLSGRSH